MDGFFLQQNVSAVGGRGDSGGTYQRPDPSEVENETELLNHHHVGASGSTIYLTADGNGEVHLGTTGEAEARSEEEDSRRRRKNFTMRDPQESHHRLPLGEVESGDDSDCVVVAAPSERKVEPLKINLARDREPIRTIIKLTPGTGGSVLDSSSCSQQLSPTIREVPGSPKITIKPPKPPPPSTMEGPGGGGASSSASVGGTNPNSNSVLSQPSTSTTVLPNSSSIPKVTIKPVINPAEELLTVEAPAEQMQIIPKLLIKGSSLDASIHGVTEPHIVPKLTIRGVNNHNHHFHHHNHQHHPPESHGTQSTGDGTGTQVAVASASGSPTTPSTPLVPKLTIKMDNHHPHHHPHVQQSQQHNNLRMKDVADAGSGGSGNRVESPIPKLHIKAILPEAGGSCSIQSPPSIGGSGSNVLATPSVSGNSLTSSEGVKLTIKPLPEPKLPKLTIKTTGLGTIAETSDASMVSSTSCSFSPKMMPAGMMVVGGGNSHDLQHHHHHHHHQQHNQIQLLTVAQQQPASPSDQHSNISSSSIPKITIKPIPAKLGLQQQQSPTGSAAGNASMGGADLPPTVPRLTIKPIPPPPTDSTKQSTGEDSNSSSETSINSLESSPVSSSCSSSSVATSAVITTSALRMTIKVSPQQDASSAGTTSSSTVTKLNIKPILPPPFPNPTGEANEPGTDEVSPPSEGEEVDPSAAPIVIPKVTIKTLANPRSQETEILSTPKVTLKPIPKPTGHELLLPGSPAMGQSAVERHSPQAQATANSIGHAALNSNNSPTAGMTASDGGGSMDSPRIILKINKGSSSTTTTSLEQQQQQSDGMDTTESNSISHPPPMGGSSILANELKRPAANTAAGSITPFSSSSSSASSTTVSISTSSSSAGSDPASPSSSAGGGDQGEPGSPDAKKSKLELVAAGVARVAREQQKKFVPHQLSEHNAALRQSLLENHQQQQQQLLQKAQQQQTALVGTGGQPPVADVIVIDDDSKSENESSERGENEKPAVDSSHEPTSVSGLNLAPASLRPQPMFAFMNNEATTIEVVKPRRTRGTSRGAGGGRQSRRGAGGGRGTVAKQQAVVTDEPPRLNVPEVLVNHDDNDEGSSSDCMIVDDPSAATTTISSVPTPRSGLSLESLLLGGGGIKQPGLYNATHTGGSNELEKNGTASNSSIGSVSSSIGSTAIPASPATATPGIRMSTRRGAGQLLKEVLANKHHDRDSGVDDEARTDGESGPHHGGPTPSKRPRGRPKKQSVDLTMETNGNGGSSSSLEGNGGAIPDSNMMMALAMMSGGAGGAEGVTFLRPDGPGMLGTHQLMEGIMPLQITPVRTPRTRGRGRGRGRGKLALLDGATVAQSPNLDPLEASRRNFALPPGVGGSGGNGDPLFIDPAADPTSFNLLFNHAGTPRGAGSVRTRGGRRGVGSRGARTPRGGGRGAAKAARAALLLANTPIVGQISPEANEEGIVEPSDPLESPKSQPSGESPPTGTPVGGRGRARAPRGSGTASKRNATASGRKAPRGKKAQEAAALLAAAEAAASPKNAINPANTIFMTPMAGGLDLNRPKLHVRELKTPKNAIKSNTPPSSAQTTPLAGATPAGTPGETTPGDGGLQVFEEDTRMSGDFNFTTPARLMMSSGDGCLQPNEESQSSYLSSTSVTQDATGASATGGQSQPPAGAADGLVPGSASSTSDAQKDSLTGAISTGNSNSSSSRRPKGKMEVLDAHRAAFTVELLAEYEWPRPSPGTRGTDSFMLQEQIAEYLGVKSFKRKYPDLMRRPVDMEERNFLLEQGLASEKMCDLGLTAVYASEILDIMCSDYPEKYEEYTRYTREKHFRELSSRQQRQQLEAFTSTAATPAVATTLAAVPIDRVKLQKEKAIESAASWNSSFNRERRDTRRACMDLQTYVVQVPKRYQSIQAQSKAKSEGATNYPVALVPGQFSEYYSTYTPEELACYPINTILLDPEQLKEIVSSERYRRLVAAEEARLQGSDDDSSSSSSSSDGSSDEDSDTSSSSSSDEDDDGSSTDSSCSSSSARSSTFSDCDHCDASGVKNELDRRKRTGMSVNCEKNDEISITAASGPPVRRSSRALSAGTVVVPSLVVETKDPTDSDDSDVPLIAHAVRKKNLQSSTNAATPLHPSAGGGKRMQETMSPVKRPPLDPFMCAVCLGPENKNRYSKPERFVRCNRCRRKAHPSCIGMSSVMYRRVQQYKWQCSECKLCMKCNRCPLATDSKMVYCDQCDRGYHLACKGLRNLPEGRWQCSICTICGQCGARTPEGHPNPHLNAQQRQHLAMVAEWTHEYGVNELTKIREHLRTLCVPCVRQRRQRLQQPDQISPIPTVGQQDAHGGGSPIVSSNCETKAILNNNNNPTDQRKQPQQAQLSLPVQQQGGAIGGMSVAGTAGSIKPQSQQYMINSTTIKQQPHMMIVQTGSGIPNSHVQSGTKGGTMTGGGEVRR